jgi:integrase/recombinase XerD
MTIKEKEANERRQGKSRLLQKDELKRVMQFQTSGRHPIRNVAILHLSFYCGLRVGEISKLVLKDLVNDSWELKEEVVLKKEITKTKQTRAFYIVHKDIKVALTKYIEERRKEITTNEVRGWKKLPLFVSQKGGAFSPKSLQRVFKIMFEQVGLDEQCSSHSGRRTFISNLITQNVDMKTVSTLAGHSNIQTTMNTYATPNPQKMENVCRNLTIK